MVTEKMIEAALTFKMGSVWDKGLNEFTAACERDSMRKILEVALSAEDQLEPFGWTSKHVNDGEQHRLWGRNKCNVLDYPGQVVQELYIKAPASPTAVKALQWKEDGKYLKARMGDREYSLNITSDGKTWAGSTRPYAFGWNLTWSAVPNCSFLSLEKAKAACQADCQSRYSALSAHSNDVAGLSEWQGWDKSRMPWSESKHKDAVCRAAFGEAWSMNDAAALIGFIERTWTAAPAAKQEG
ncbi:hypothetical protein JZX86_05655 [Agrobacterium rosae]|uniref:hypothetical protein n=1 Tax=Agrobacterium rosae TaxID=1972867 RepID=UPI0019D37251|nr:hypothetical protein [Agrobacterium rosae]MBN7804848.1 hypothetical protein [Agrobacterium rosae]